MDRDGHFSSIRASGLLFESSVPYNVEALPAGILAALLVLGGMGATAVASLWQDGASLWATLAPVVFVWVFGAVIGLLLPRPKGLLDLLGSPLGLLTRRLTLTFHGLYIVREVWLYWTLPGTAHALLQAVYGLLMGQGWSLELPAPVRLERTKAKKAPVVDGEVHPSSDTLDWYITDSDLEFFKDRIERDVDVGARPWDHVLTKSENGWTYSAWRGIMPDGKTEYKSITVAKDATAEECMDFYLDDPARMKWDAMISHHETLEEGPAKHRCQVVRWVRSFPFSFLSDREYIIGRRVWRAEDGCLYGITKSVVHPRAVDNSRIVRMDVFYSMWRNRTIPCPDGSGRPACETILLHREDFKIPENLARFAVRHGMAGFVKKMTGGVRSFIDARRARVDMFAEDPNAFGMNCIPNPPLFRSDSEASISVVDTETATEASTTDADSEISSVCTTPRAATRRRRKPVTPAGQARGLVAAGVAVAVAVLLGRSSARKAPVRRRRSAKLSLPEPVPEPEVDVESELTL